MTWRIPTWHDTFTCNTTHSHTNTVNSLAHDNMHTCVVSVIFAPNICTLWCVAVCCSVLQCVAGCCSVLQCVAVCCRVLQCVAVCCSALQRIAVCCSVLQCVAVYCNVLYDSLTCDMPHFHIPCLSHAWHDPYCLSMSVKGSLKRTNIHPEYNQTLLHETWPIFMFYDWFICNLLICNAPTTNRATVWYDYTGYDRFFCFMTDSCVTLLLILLEHVSARCPMRANKHTESIMTPLHITWLIFMFHDSFISYMPHTVWACWRKTAQKYPS